MDKKLFFTLTMIIIAALALTVFNLKLFPAQAQPSDPAYLLTITGLVQNPLSLTLADIKAMPQTTEYAALYCVDAPGTPLEQGNWTGVELSYLLQQANVSSDAIKVAFFASDGFTTDLTVQMAMKDDSILVAYQLDGASLSGLRLVVPDNWGYKWINDLTQIKLVNYNFLGTEESAGYPDNATTGGTAMPGDGQPELPILTPNPAAPTQSSTPTPTILPQLPSPTDNSTTSPAASNSKPHSTSEFLVYIATFSAIIVIFAVASATTLIKRKKAKMMKRELKDSQITQMVNQ
jgi:hypothetical protein